MTREKANISYYPDGEKENLLLLLLENISQLKEKYRDIVSAGIAQWVKNGRIDTGGDLKKLIELDIEFQKDEEI
ncbi:MULTISPECIES: hypothetical protein [Bacillus]|uniref:hypothetical protein n=1 Tax=Bacillus TaxID=1386 RepID=UPI0006AED9E8|nr:MULTISPECIES: hypothetical protein [Bacillus]AWD89024.1 hypothetical protein BVQ_16880 [Bacillus velezensis]AWM52936.1 hypothetical protein DDT10_15190 [Bacillus amyloliquefaciens]KAF6694385.1 hypothetical protein G9362_07510 [Bacillus sp. EKM601B]KOS49491.1 hypothetical protein AN272_18125 [Bacillus amyloliquefaciens]MBA9148410.1 hypothetical protein [Bacillus sp. EKM213B]